MNGALSLSANTDVEALAQRLWRTAAPSPVAAHVRALLDDPAATLADVTQAVLLDPTVAARITRAVNTAYFGQKEPVRVVGRAIQLMGFDGVRALLAEPGLLQCFALRAPGQAAVNARLEGLWLHSVAAGVAARHVAARLGVSDDNPYFAAGLLHDVGKVALLLLRAPDYERAIWQAMAEGLPLAQTERRVFGFDHAHMGRALCEQWGVPEAIAGAVGRHHSVRSGGPREAYSDLAATAQLADILARTLGLGWWGDRVMPRLEPATRTALELIPDDAAALLEAIEADLPAMLTTLHSLIIPTPLPPI